jgi:NAD(P)H-dependent FMN reductase
MSKPKIQVILPSIRQNRAGKKVAEWVMRTIADIDTAEFELVDLLDYNLPFFDDAVSPSQRTGVHPNPLVATWLAKLDEADGYIILANEYNHSVPGAFKNAIDFIGSEWKNKAVGFISYGGMAGGARAVEHLRQIASEMHMHDVRDQLLIPAIWAAFDEAGNLKDSEHYTKTAHTVVHAVIELANRLRGSN